MRLFENKLLFRFFKQRKHRDRLAITRGIHRTYSHAHSPKCVSTNRRSPPNTFTSSKSSRSRSIQEKEKKKNRKKRETPQHLFSHQLSRFTCALAQRSNFFTELPHRTKKRAISHPSIRVVDTHCSYSSCPCDVAAFRKLSSDR